MNVNNLYARMCPYDSKLKESIHRVIESGWLVLGHEVNQFEQSFADYCGAAHCISLANGTDAIELALRAMGIKRGNRVATVANAGMYTTTALQAIGAEPWYIDVNLSSRNVSLAAIEQALDEGVRAVVVTHLYGLAVPEIDDIAAFCRHRNVPLLEDCAQAHGACVAGRRVGTFGDAGCFSFYPTKNLGALGDGGSVVTNCREIAERVKQLRQYGWTSKYTVEIAGARNSRLDEIQAAILLVFLPDLDVANARRRAIANQYSEEINHPKVNVPGVFGEEYVAHLYVVRAEEREALRHHLKSRNIGTDIHYPIPDYRQPVFGNRFESVFLENTERLSGETLTLPCYPEMTDSDVSRVIEAVNSWGLYE